MPHKYDIHPARLADLPQLPDVETSAAELFASYPEYAFLMQDASMSAEQHQTLLRTWSKSTGEDSGGTWVAILSQEDKSSDDHGSELEEIVGFVATSLETTSKETSYVYIHELGICFQHQRRGLASRLPDAIKAYCQTRNSASGATIIAGLTLTTMRDLPFNRPFYEKLGFHECDPDSVEEKFGPWALAMWKADQERFARVRDQRCFMVFTL